MSRACERLRGYRGGSEGARGEGAVGRGDAGGGAREVVDGVGVGGAVALEVVRDH